MISKLSLYSDYTDSIDDDWVIVDGPNDGSESKSVIFLFYTQKMLELLGLSNQLEILNLNSVLYRVPSTVCL